MKKSKVLVIDNYDSFTYNLVYILRELGVEPDIFRNDQIKIAEIEKYDKILLSPGPGLPDDAGIMNETIKFYGKNKSILGVCLGHQGIAQVYNSKLYNLTSVLHGVTSKLSVLKNDDKLFKGLPSQFDVGLYHSWAVDKETLSPELEITAINDSGIVMAISHRKYDVVGLQFHPESIMTKFGKPLIKNWLE